MENDAQPQPAQPQPQQQARRSTRQQSQKEKEVGKRKKDEEDKGTTTTSAATTTTAAAAAAEGVVKTKKKTKEEVQQEREERLKQEELQFRHDQHQPAPLTPLCWATFCEKVVPYMKPTDMVATALVTKESYRYVHAGDGCWVCIFWSPLSHSPIPCHAHAPTPDSCAAMSCGNPGWRRFEAVGT